MNDIVEKRTNPWLGLIAWLALVFSATLSSVFVSTGGWYAELNKPTWNPPSWIFGPVWTLLYILMAVAAWRVWSKGGWSGQRRALSLFVVQWALNALWTPIFFGLQQPGWAFVEIMILLVLIRYTIKAFLKVDQTAALLMLPYAIWVGFAAALNLAIWRMN